MKQYIKMNDGNNYLSLGNLFKTIKSLSKNSNNTIQVEIFCTLFNVNDINTTTVNNYCIGCRSIGNLYKQQYILLKKNYLKNNLIMTDIIINLLSLIEGNIYSNINDKKEFINSNISLKQLVDKLYTIAKCDRYVSNTFTLMINDNINKNNYYDSFIEILFYIVLDHKQPIYEIDQIKETINNLLKKTNISVNDLEDVLNIELTEGLNYVHSLKELEKKNNPYALYKLGILEFHGEICGKKRIIEALNYFKKAASYNHPASNWMIAYLIINEYIGNKSNEDIETIWKYLEKAKELGSIASINTMGVCYLKGLTKDKIKDETKAMEYFEIASKKGYVYSLNNLGKIYETKHNYTKAMEYYLKSANEGESWASNRLGEYYRLGKGVEKNLSQAFFYYTKSCSSSIKETCQYANYNLAKYFYLNGNSELLIVKDRNLAKELLKKANLLMEAKIELLNLYIDEYKKSLNNDTYLEISLLLQEIKNSPNYNYQVKQTIDKTIKSIKQSN